MSIHYAYILPNAHAPAWRDVWAHSAAARGWSVVHHWGTTPPDLHEGENVLIIVSGPMAGGPPGKNWTVVAPPAASSIVEAVHRQFGSDRAIAIGHAMHCLAHASDLVQRGASLVRTTDPTARSPFGDIVGPVHLPDLAAAERWPLYDEIPPRKDVAFVLPLSLFKVPTKTGMEGGTQPIDLTGRGRIIFHGPYVELPQGEWSVRVRFRYDGYGKQAPFRFEWGVGSEVESIDVVVREAGDYEIDLFHVWDQIAMPQLRIWLYHAVFQGQFEVLEVTLFHERFFTSSTVVA